jgi:hypothetical protein
MASKDGFDFDARAIERMFKSLERDVLPTAQAGLLNGMAFGARKSLLKHAETTIQGGPTPFTKRAFTVDKAVPSAATMAAVVKVQPQQARYLQYLINGGKRQAGDPGAGQYDVLVDGTDTNAFGNLRRGFLRKISRQAKAERTKRARLRAQRDKARETGKDIKKFAWKTKGAPTSSGIFFGELHGLRGYLLRSNDAKKVTFLARFSDSAEYRKTFLWDKEIGSAVILYNPSKAYAAELQRAMGKLKK